MTGINAHKRLIVGNAMPAAIKPVMNAVMPAIYATKPVLPFLFFPARLGINPLIPAMAVPKEHAVASTSSSTFLQRLTNQPPAG